MKPETRPTANEIKSMLGLERHPTCGFVAETYRSSLRIPEGALPTLTRAPDPMLRRSTSSSPRTPGSSCTVYAPTSSTVTTWATL